MVLIVLCTKIYARKLSLYGFSIDSVDLINAYLSGRKQCVVVGGKSNQFLEINTGVPQGSIVGPFLYNLYVQEHQHVLDMMCPHTAINQQN